MVTGLKNKKNGLKMKNTVKIKRFFDVGLDVTSFRKRGYDRRIVSDMNLRASYNDLSL